MRFRGPGSVRLIGLAIAVEFEDSRIAEDLRERCREAGLLVTLGGESAVVLFPPLNIDRKTARLGLDVFERCAAGRHALRRGA
jgi:4-aminobutyrate aminotransferase-like enzyme